MPILDQSNPLPFFGALHRIFGAQLACGAGEVGAINRLMACAFDSFERNVDLGSNGLASVACYGGCASCCAIRVAATAPELLWIARAIRSSPAEAEVELRRRIAEADRATKRVSALNRMLAGVVCPFINQDLCAIYPIRPLACRGHVSFDERACRDAMTGCACEVPVSALHMTVRSLVQNALQSALRDAGLAWATYELNQGLQIALSDDACESGWISGNDVFAPARIAEVSLDEMAETFDAIKAALV